jgi:hypothetical protein
LNLRGQSVRAIDVFVNELDLEELGFGGVEPENLSSVAYAQCDALSADPCPASPRIPADLDNQESHPHRALERSGTGRNDFFNSVCANPKYGDFAKWTIRYGAFQCTLDEFKSARSQRAPFPDTANVSLSGRLV